jgi:putative ABC transport system permease protein
MHSRAFPKLFVRPVLHFLLELRESFAIALRAIWVNKMRSTLTSLGIIIGIASVTSMATVINGIEQGFDASMSDLGADVLYVEQWPWSSGPGDEWWKYRNRPRITADLIDPIERRSQYAVAITPVVETRRSAQYRGQTVSNVWVQGSTVAYERVHPVPIETGRFFSDLDDRGGRRVAVIGSQIAEALFLHEEPLGKTIRLGGHPFLVIGVLEHQGQTMGGPSRDTRVMIPFSAFQGIFGTAWRNTSIQVRVSSAEDVEQARDELTGILRSARRLDAMEEDNFVINDQKNLRESLAPVKRAIYGIGIFLTALSLLVGGIGVMNIMFVSVKERTREIGLRKALGARRMTILIQFLIEAMVVCLIGGVIGVGLSLVLTVLINLVITAILPLGTVILAFSICLLIGLVFGLAPAWAAARSEPIESLRYE